MNPIKKYIINLYVRVREAEERMRLENLKSRLLSCGEDVIISRGADLIPETIEIGNHVLLGHNVCILSPLAKVHIGNHVGIGPNTSIRGGNHRIDLVGRYIDTVTEDEKLPENDADVYIGDDVWIGANVTILKGVHIGEGCVVGAGSVVTRDIPPYTIHVGVHGPYETRRFTDEEIAEHRRLLHLEERGM